MNANSLKIIGPTTITLFALLALAEASATLCAATITVTNTADSGAGSLRAALASAANGDTINFLLPKPAKVTLISGELLVTKSVTILGPGPADLAVDANASSRVFHINPGRIVTLAGLTVTNGLATGAFPAAIGGGIYIDHAVLTVSNCVVSGNSATNVFGGGGGIYNHGAGGTASLFLLNSIVSGNAARAGGGIWNDGLNGNASLQIVNSVLSSNAAPVGSGGISYNAGGAIYNDGRFSGHTSARLVGSTLAANLAYSGGGIFNDGSDGDASLTVSNCILSGNLAISGSGAGILNFGGGGVAALTVLSSALSSNSADSVGGGIFNDGRPTGISSVQIANSTFGLNTARSGGAIYSVGSSTGAVVTVSGSTFSGNSAAAGGGGGIYNDTGGTGTTNCTVSGNSAASGGGFYNTAGTLTIVGSTFSGNSARYVGGGIFNDGRSGNATLQLGDTVLNTGASRENIFNLLGMVVSLGYNLSSDNGGGFLTAVSDQINTDPRLGPLQNNGGPTFTHALLSCSPAIDRGKDLGGSATDQRGVSRTFDDLAVANAVGGDGTDIGAFEAQTQIFDTTPPSTTCPADIVIHGLSARVVNFVPLVRDDCDLNPTVICSPRSGSVFPLGTSTVMCQAADASGNSSRCSFTISVVDQPPAADASATAPWVISANNTDANVILDGSRSSDPDGDPLQYTWYETGSLWSSGVVALTTLPVGTHSIHLVVSDGALSATNGITIEVITAGEAVNRLAATLSSGVPRPQPLLATLNAAIASADRSNPISAINQLVAFQSKVRAQIEPMDPALAASLIQSAQEVIDVLSGGNTNRGGHPHGRFTSMTRQPDGRVGIRFSGEQARAYIIEASTNMTDWEMIGAATTGSDGSWAFEDAQAVRFAQRFYRMILP